MAKRTFLDTNFFDDNSKLKTDIRDVLLMMQEDVFKDIKSKKLEVEINPSFVVLTGSLCGGGWDEFSDVDLHIGIDFSIFENESLVKNFLKEYSKVFNEEGYDLAGRHVELYFQDIKEKHVSPGVYDIINDVWLVMPISASIYIPEAVSKTSGKLLSIVLELVEEYDKLEKSRGSVSRFYVKVKSLWDRIKSTRKKSISKSGLNGFGNLVFKRLRRNGTLASLSSLIHRAKNDIYEVWDRRYKKSSN